MHWFTSIVSLALLLTSIATAYSNPKSCTGTCTNAHDPSIIRRDSDGKYFRFSTGGKIAIHTAPAITGPWTYIGAMLPSCSSISLSGNCDLWVRPSNPQPPFHHLTHDLGSLRAQSRQYVLRLLQRQHIRLPRFRHRSSDLLHHGRWHLDRRRGHRRNLVFRKGLQRN